MIAPKLLNKINNYLNIAMNYKWFNFVYLKSLGHAFISINLLMIYNSLESALLTFKLYSQLDFKRFE